jgi:hypothetical protein
MIGQMPRACGLPVGLGVIPLIGHGGSGLYVGSDIEQDLELTAVAGLAPGQVEVERIAFEIGLQMMVWTAPDGIDCVESRCGAVALGRTYPLPPLSSGGASLVRRSGKRRDQAQKLLTAL